MQHIEQDRAPAASGDALPTYDDLAAQEGPNSRFGRWRGWIEKRAAERYQSITPEERERRRARGWGNAEMDALDPEPPTPTSVSGLTVQTNNLRLSTISTLSEPPPDSPPLPPIPAVSTRLRPTHLKMNQFGSRFLPHSTVPIRCLLPLQADRLLLIGHEEGLSVLDLFPQDWTEGGGIDLKGPEDARVYHIWQGESVFQMSILELDSASGVVLMLVAPESETPIGKDMEGHRTVRMYNLASLISLAKWSVANKGATPLQLGSFTVSQTTPKKHRPTSSIARGFKSLIPPSNQDASAPTQSYQTLLSPSSSIRARTPPTRNDSDDSTWELVDDLPLRWARDFVPLAAAGSRLLNLSILSFALWKREEGNFGQFLAVATKGCILLYETPKNERAFRFVKEFYTPLQPKVISFFQQTVHEIARSPTDVHGRHRRNGSNGNNAAIRASGGRTASVSSPRITNYGAQLSIFVVFEKKAGWIRLADSAVGEMELADDAASPHNGHLRAVSMGPTGRRRSAPESHVYHHGWIPPVRAELPSRSVYLLTRGITTHIMPCPLPAQASTVQPLGSVTWHDSPSHVSPRLGPHCLQLVALGQGSVEVQEVPLSILGGDASGKGKGKASEPVVLRAEEDAGGETGFLSIGGHWDDARTTNLQRTYSTASDASFQSVDTDEMVDKLRREQGVYGWCRKGLSDWRVFWLGGGFVDEPEDSEEGNDIDMRT
ncbi:hypothetical protein MIND_00795700 [Mycena indigotica]|uniref:Uncharacterized protein n=1 Tax=Mycena indigotica TaxID=2126181 RepID=A0A8H6SMY6_9AGAR|nr:uncharacterized protein MIND_00795700 [Mycena indigotica]KAF7302284.1 hypothetical protein MIND_00795700 [Mycena indigotica]